MWGTNLFGAGMNHINGNAVYNLKHPLMLQILDALNKEKSELGYLKAAYDLRIREVIEEIRGTSPRFSNSEVAVKESRVIANYVDRHLSINRIKALESASLIHGAKFYDSWSKDKHFGVSLDIRLFVLITMPVTCCITSPYVFSSYILIYA